VKYQEQYPIKRSNRILALENCVGAGDSFINRLGEVWERI
jgi:hypothetical protein